MVLISVERRWQGVLKPGKRIAVVVVRITKLTRGVDNSWFYSSVSRLAGSCFPGGNPHIALPHEPRWRHKAPCLVLLPIGKRIHVHRVPTYREKFEP